MQQVLKETFGAVDVYKRQGLVFVAEVVIGENFDPDNFYVSTGKIMKPDEEKWNTLSVYEMFFFI